MSEVIINKTPPPYVFYDKNTELIECLLTDEKYYTKRTGVMVLFLSEDKHQLVGFTINPHRICGDKTICLYDLFEILMITNYQQIYIDVLKTLMHFELDKRKLIIN